jgi:rod shape-determining protein MreC
MRLTNPRVELAGPRPRRGGLVLASTLVFCVLLLSAQAPARARRGTMLQAWILSAAAPIATTTSAASRAISGAVDGAGELFAARRENTRLKRELAAAEREVFTLRARVSQDALDGRLSSRAGVLPAVICTAPVLLVENRAGLQSVVVGAGSGEGVKPGSPIAVPEGIVGRVVAVGRAISRAQILLDASAAAGARVVRTGDMGVVRGDGRGGMRLNNLPTTSRVKVGDVVESAGIDGIYPRGVPIGRVTSVARGSGLFLDIRVAPAAPFSQLTDVLVLAPSPATQEVLGGGRGAGQ